jgi:diguanylate cyclase (GGDEF)-like protein
LLQVADQAMYLAKKQAAKKHPTRKRGRIVLVNTPLAVSEAQAQARIVNLQAIAAGELQSRGAIAASGPAQHRGLSSWIKSKFLDHCNRILSPQLRADPDQLIRGRTLIGMARFIQLATVFVIVNLWVIATSAIDHAVVLGIAIFGATLSALLAFLHRTGNLAASINILLFIAFMVMQLSTLLNGGIAKSPSMDSVVLPVLMAFCLSGRRLGLIWAALTVVFHIGVAIAISRGVDVALVQRPPLAQESIGGWGVGFIGTLLIIHVFESINVRLQRERDREYAELEFLATHDALTGLASRRQFHDALERALERVRNSSQSSSQDSLQRTGESLAVIYLDLDGFKPVNDALGHAVGDIVLQTVAKRIGKNVRGVDTVARLGGDEFGIVLQNVRTPEDAARIAAQIRHDISRPIAGLEMFSISGSIGIAMAPQHSDDSDTLVRMADQAMFRAKAQKDTVAVYQ